MGIHLENRSALQFWCFIIALVALLSGFTLTILSWLQICTDECAIVHRYQFYGIPFEIIGFIFFPVSLLAHLLSYHYPIFWTLNAMFLAGGVGAEINFIGVQQFEIGLLCPICLSIALCVFIAASAYFVVGLKPMNQGAFTMYIHRIIPSLVLIFGFLISFFGVFKPEKSFAEGIESGNPAFGNLDSNIEVYVFTDWFCPGCRIMDKQMSLVWPQVMKKAKIYFIDFPIHPESKNFIPYNLSFMIHNKKKYIELRDVLHHLSKTTKTPKIKEVQNAIKPLGITYEPLDFEDIDSGVRFFDGNVQSFDVKVTPTIVVANRETLESKKLEGREISKESIFEVIKDLEGEESSKTSRDHNLLTIPGKAHSR